MRIAVLLTIVCILVVGLSACKTRHNYRPGGPYYFKGGITYEGYFPTEEISKADADTLASEGFAYYTAYFNDNKRPTIIQKYYRGATTKTELYYQEQNLVKVVNTDSDGKIRQIEELFYKNGKLESSSSIDGNGNKRWLMKDGKLIK